MKCAGCRIKLCVRAKAQSTCLCVYNDYGYHTTHTWLYTRMQQQSYAADFQIHIRFSEEHQGYKVLDIYSVDATKRAAVHIIQRAVLSVSACLPLINGMRH